MQCDPLKFRDQRWGLQRIKTKISKDQLEMSNMEKYVLFCCAFTKFFFHQSGHQQQWQRHSLSPALHRIKSGAAWNHIHILQQILAQGCRWSRLGNLGFEWIWDDLRIVLRLNQVTSGELGKHQKLRQIRRSHHPAGRRNSALLPELCRRCPATGCGNPRH